MLTSTKSQWSIVMRVCPNQGQKLVYAISGPSKVKLKIFFTCMLVVAKSAGGA